MTVPLGILASARTGTATWSSPAIPSARYMDAHYSSGFTNKYIATSIAGGYQYSPDGISYTPGTQPFSRALVSATGSYWIMVASEGSGGAGNAAYSSDGATWTTIAAPAKTGSDIKKLMFDGTRALFASDGKINYSATGTSWTTLTVTNAGCSIAWDGSSTYLTTALTAGASGVKCTSNPTVAGNWSNYTAPISGTNDQGIVYGNGTFVIFRAHTSTSYYTSTNSGTTWTTRTLPASLSDSTNDSYMKIGYLNGLFYFYKNGNVYTSPDAVTWTTTAVPGLSATTPIYKGTGWLFDGVNVQGFGMATTTGTANTGPTIEYILGAY